MKIGARLALAALAVQFVLTFGHVHESAALAAPGLQAASAAVAPGNTGIAPDAGKTAKAQQTAADDSQSNPQGHHHDDYCAICAVMALAGSLITSQPAILLYPQAYEFLSRTTDAGFSHLAAPHGISQPRAPPPAS